jgi:hypothetical protein
MGETIETGAIRSEMRKHGECENSINSSDKSKEVLSEHCSKKDKPKEDLEVISYGKNFGFRCEDKDGVSSGGNIFKDGECFSSIEAGILAERECSKPQLSSNNPMTLVSISNWEVCEKPHDEFGKNFGFRCEDEDGLSAGGNIFKDGACFSSSEAKVLAAKECDKLHPVSNKPMMLISISNWDKCI